MRFNKWGSKNRSALAEQFVHARVFYFVDFTPLIKAIKTQFQCLAKPTRGSGFDFAFVDRHKPKFFD